MIVPNSSFNYDNFTEGVQDYSVHYYYFYVHPVMTFLAILSNILSAVVFAQKELFFSGHFFQYSLVNSIGTAVGMLFLSVFCVTRCGPLCPQAYTQWTQFYEIYLVYFVGSTLYFCGSLIQIAISCQIYLSITQKFKRLNELSPFKVIAGFILVGVLFGLSILFSFKIVHYKYVIIMDDVSVWFDVYQNALDFSHSSILVYLAIFMLVVSNKIFLVILVVINCLLYIELRKIINKKKTLVNSNSNMRELSRVLSNRFESSVDLNLTAVETLSKTYQPKKRVADKSDRSKKKTLIMVLWVSIFFSSSRFVFAIANLILLFLQNSVYNWWGSAISYCYTAIVYMSYLFVYLKTNKVFKKKFFQIFFRKKI